MRRKQTQTTLFQCFREPAPDDMNSLNVLKGSYMLFYKVLILFWGCTRTCSHARWFENHIIFHIIYIITIPLSPAWHKKTWLVPGLMKARPPKN